MLVKEVHIIERNTIQRTLVYQTVQKLANHPTADEVYNAVGKKHPNISKATVYRNLNGLVAQGLMGRVHVPDAADKFDHRIEPHYHIFCRKCGAFADAGEGYDQSLDERIALATGFKSPHHDLFFTGLCASCAAQEQNENRA